MTETGFYNILTYSSLFFCFPDTGFLTTGVLHPIGQIFKNANEGKKAVLTPSCTVPGSNFAIANASFGRASIGSCDKVGGGADG